jgi:omega-6 fatty acid desaturase (delta-12 desaturase)
VSSATNSVPWAKTLGKYKHPDRLKSCWQVANSLVPFCGLWYFMVLSLAWSYWLTLLFALPTAGFLVRIFIIQHDCGHHSFFRSRRANDLLGSACSVLTLTPYYLWRRSHARHHASSGDLSHRGQGDVAVLTVDEYLNRTWSGRMRYRLYRNPLVMFVVGATYMFVLHQRLTLGVPRAWRRERRGVHATNLCILAAVGVAWWTIGLSAFLLVHAPIVILGSAAGTWLFYVQHQYEHTYWQSHDDWNFTASALAGSSYYSLPRVLQWFSGNIGFHHIHHLDSRIPNYHLPACYAAEPALRDAATLGIRDSLRCAALKLWDERQQRLVTFAEAHRESAAHGESTAIVESAEIIPPANRGPASRLAA